MEDKIKSIIIFFIIFSLSLLAWIKPTSSYSYSERRKLASLPEISLDNIISGRFMKDFEAYALDQFPFRAKFRSIKNASSLYLFGQSDVNGLYIYNGHIVKIDYPLNQAMVERAEEKFQTIYDDYLKDKNINAYMAIIPDKNYLLREEAGRLFIDYPSLVSSMRARLDYIEYIDILPLLSIDNYYYTDSHWKQEDLIPIAKKISSAMGSPIVSKYKINETESEFYGVYYGQLLLEVEADKIKYLTNDIMDKFKVTDYNMGKEKQAKLYDLSKLTGRDPYEIYLCGNSPLVVIDNPKATNDKELVIFRDSFASSISPLLATGYKKTSLVDIRYISPSLIDRYIDFENQDVLFLYSTLVLNKSSAFK